MEHDIIRRCISYDASTGKIARLDRNYGFGSIDAYGYLIIKIKGKQYKAHRLAWFMHYGDFPKHTIDHINGNRLDNRICNLRDIPQSANAKFANKRKPPNKDTGIKGVYVDKTTKGLIAKYTTHIDGKTYRFRNLNDAVKLRTERNLGV